MKYPEITTYNNQPLDHPPPQKKKKKKKRERKEERREEAWRLPLNIFLSFSIC